MNPRIAAGVIATTTYRKRPSRRYFSPRSGRSIHRGGTISRPVSLRPAFQSYSDRVPTGQSHEQNDFLRRNEIARKTTSRKRAAGCSFGASRVARKYLRFISAAMGIHPSTPGGRGTNRTAPPDSKWRTKSANSNPIQRFSAAKRAWKRSLSFCE
jgi:hypothetical protein